MPIARRIADHVALAVSHEQLAELARQAAEAEARAERLEARVQVAVRRARPRQATAAWSASRRSGRRCCRAATQVAATDTTVLLLGESGTGKEVVARFIHRASARSEGRSSR